MTRTYWQSFTNTFTGLPAIYARELRTYIRTPMAYVFLGIFLLSLGVLTWEAGRFFETNRADLTPFFVWHPWLYTVFLPALAMRLWADEQAGGTDELLLSLPVGLGGLIMGKLFAAWTVTGFALILTLPMWISVNFLGSPIEVELSWTNPGGLFTWLGTNLFGGADNIAIFVTYIMSFLMAGAYLSIGMALSAIARSQVTAFVMAVFVAFLFTVAGWPLVLSGVTDSFGVDAADSVARLSFLSHFEAAQRGVLEWRSVFYFVGFIGLWSTLCGLWVARLRE
ncbi:MAG: ABC transporter permease subunit [Hyphomonadaceae bacterium]